MGVAVVDAGSYPHRRAALPVGAGPFVLHVVSRVVCVVAFVVAIAAAFVLFAGAGVESPSSGQVADVAVPLVVLAIAGTVAVLTAIVSARLARLRHGLVLYLRRFGPTPGMEAVTAGAVGALGRTWRLVTLDDARAMPVGVSSRTRRTSDLLATGRSVGGALIGVPIAVANGVLIIAFWTATLLLVYTWFEHRGLPVTSLLGHLHSLGTAAGLVEPLLVVALASLGLLVLLLLVQALVKVTLSVPASYLASVERTRHLMETAHHEGIRARSDLARVAHEIAHRSHRGSSARLWVVRVDSAFWQETVLQLARLSQRILIDVSEPSRNVTWEVVNVTAVAGRRCVLVGARDRVKWLARASAADDVADRDRQLLRALDGRTVLAYGDDRAEFCEVLSIALRRGL